MDIAAANDYAKYVSVLRNLSDPGVISFALPDTFGTRHKFGTIIAADFDGDTKPDIAIPGSILRNYSSTGAIEFASLEISGLGSDAFAVADFDVDGKIDLTIGLRVLHNTSSVGEIHFDFVSLDNPSN